MDIREMVTRAREGDAEAFRALYFSYHDKLYFFCMMLTDDPTEADSIFQYSFSQAFQQLSMLKKPEYFKNWLYIIAANRSCMLPRTGESVYEEHSPVLDLGMRWEVPDIPEFPELEDAALREVVLNQTRKLPFSVRLAEILYFYCGITLNQIAKLLECDEEEARQHISDAVFALDAGVRQNEALAGFDARQQAGIYYFRCAEDILVSEELSEEIINGAVALTLAARVAQYEPSEEEPQTTEEEPEAPTETIDAVDAEEIIPAREETDDIRPAKKEKAPMSAEARSALRNTAIVVIVVLLAAGIIAGAFSIIRDAGKNPPPAGTDTDRSTVDVQTNEPEPPVSDEQETTDAPETETDPPETEPPVTETEPPVTETEPPVSETEPPADEPTPDMYFDCKVTDAGVSITKYTGTAKEVILPSVIDGKTVTAISTSAFEGNTSVVSVKIPAGVTTIGQAAFRSCTALTSVTLPNTLTAIDTYAFYGCSSLNGVKVPSSVKTVGLSAFSGTAWLDSQKTSFITVGDGILIKCISGDADVTIPGTVKKITNAFYYKNSTVNVIISSGVTEIGTYAFTGCPKLKTITIPETVSVMGKDAIYDCKALSAVYVKKGSYAETWLKDNGFSTLIQYSE